MRVAHYPSNQPTIHTSIHSSTLLDLTLARYTSAGLLVCFLPCSDPLSQTRQAREVHTTAHTFTLQYEYHSNSRRQEGPCNAQPCPVRSNSTPVLVQVSGWTDAVQSSSTTHSFSGLHSACRPGTGAELAASLFCRPSHFWQSVHSSPSHSIIPAYRTAPYDVFDSGISPRSFSRTFPYHIPSPAFSDKPPITISPPRIISGLSPPRQHLDNLQSIITEWQPPQLLHLRIHQLKDFTQGFTYSATRYTPQLSLAGCPTTH